MTPDPCTPLQERIAIIMEGCQASEAKATEMARRQLATKTGEQTEMIGLGKPGRRSA
jgi:hypothetical protein